MKLFNIKVIALIVLVLVLTSYFLTNENSDFFNDPASNDLSTSNHISEGYEEKTDSSIALACNSLATTKHIAEEYEKSEYPRENNLKVLKTDQIRELPDSTDELRRCGAIIVLSNQETKPVIYTVTKLRKLEFMVLMSDGSVEYSNY